MIEDMNGGARSEPQRRRFLKQVVALGVAAGAPVSFVYAAESFEVRSVARIKSAVRRDETIVRHGGQGDIYPLTWMPDDRQFSSFSDGFGWSNAPNGAYNTRAIAISGGPSDATFQEVAGYPDLLFRWERDTLIDDPKYYAFGALAAENRLYQFLCCAQRPSRSGWGWNGVKLIYSPDQGNTWYNQDGSTPVVWESYADRSHNTLLFFEEPQEAFSLISLLQMGKNYEANRDGYAYGYGTNGDIDGIMNQLVMFRAPKDRILNRDAYKFFAGMKSNGKATWVKDIRGREVVHTFPRGWVNRPRNKDEGVVQAWLPSVVYNAPLDLYLMASSGIGCASDGGWFGKPSYLGFWAAPNPWGPWTQIHEETAWIPGNDNAARCYSPQISPKWIAPDGKSFWLVWSDYQMRDHKADQIWDEVLKDKPVKTTADWARIAEQMRRSQPYYSFNVQRYDLTVV